MILMYCMIFSPMFCVFSKILLEANICGYKYLWLAASKLLFTWIFITREREGRKEREGERERERERAAHR